MVLVAWIFFRATSLDEAFRFIGHMCTHAWLVYPEYKSGLVYVAVLVLTEWCQRAQPHGLAIALWPRKVRWAAYYVLIVGMFWYGYTEYSPFIYFQF